MKTQTWLSRHYKFILAENITTLSVSSVTFYMLFSKLQNSKCGIRVRIQKIK